LLIGIVSYNLNTFIIRAAVATVVNYDRKTFIVEATEVTIVNYNRNLFIVEVTSVRADVSKKVSKVRWSSKGAFTTKPFTLVSMVR